MIRYQSRGIPFTILTVVVIALYCLPSHSQSETDSSTFAPQPNQYQNTPQPTQRSSTALDFGPYMADLQRRLRRAWFPPRGYEDKIVVVKFKVHKDGAMSNLRLDHSSGIQDADTAALKAVENASPFRPLPLDSPDSVDIQFTFDRNVFYGPSGLRSAHYPEMPRPNNSQPVNVDYGPYMADLQRRVKKHWIRPNDYRAEAKVTVAFRIHRNGAISDLRLERSSGSEIADKAALDAIEKAAPFLPLPSQEPKESVESTFTFDSNVFTGGGPLPAQ